MSYATAETIAESEIPIIDIAPLRAGRDDGTVAAALARASHEVGFIYVRGHGIPESLIEDCRALALRFFRQTNDWKEAYRAQGCHRGFLALGQAFMSDGAKKDLKESFIWGSEIPAAERAQDDGSRHLPPPNRWPEEMPELRPALTNYFAAASDCAKDLLSGFARGLDLPKDFFTRQDARPISRATITYYPPQPAEMGHEQFGVAPHTDYGVLTVLCQDDVGGLQVQRKSDGAWVAAPPVPGTLVVNVGDLLARWTNDYFTSTPHRVINASGRERLSLVVAYDPDFETPVDAAEIWPDFEGRLPEPTTVGAYIEARLDRSFKYRQA